jgi:colanic acid/amylovoran biosynthesis glycosyltransferase
VTFRAALLVLRRWNRISNLVVRVLVGGPEGILPRIKALVHTLLGACYAVELSGREVDHIQVHHGYFGSWIAMTAARLLGIDFSMTLHGSDLLLHPSYLDVKLANCGTCFTVSEYNRRYILERYPGIDPRKVVVARLGVDVPEKIGGGDAASWREPLTLVAVGRLHAVKDHAFLVRACGRLRDAGIEVECFIAGDGPERRNLELLIRRLGLQREIMLLGHVPRRQMTSLYDRADVVVLTSRSEGIPLVLMEAMAQGRIVLAPAITGIPELVVPRKTGFLYRPGSVEDFLAQLGAIHSLMRARAAHEQCAGVLDWVRHGARVQVGNNFNRKKNLVSFADEFLARIPAQTESVPDENLVLQQI